MLTMVPIAADDGSSHGGAVSSVPAAPAHASDAYMPAVAMPADHIAVAIPAAPSLSPSPVVIPAPVSPDVRGTVASPAFAVAGPAEPPPSSTMSLTSPVLAFAGPADPPPSPTMSVASSPSYEHHLGSPTSVASPRAAPVMPRDVVPFPVSPDNGGGCVDVLVAPASPRRPLLAQVMTAADAKVQALRACLKDDCMLWSTRSQSLPQLVFIVWAVKRHRRVLLIGPESDEDVVEMYAPWAEPSLGSSEAVCALACSIGVQTLCEDRFLMWPPSVGRLTHWHCCMRVDVQFIPDGHEPCHGMLCGGPGELCTGPVQYTCKDKGLIALPTISDGDCALDV